MTQVVVASGASVDLNGTADATYGYTLSGSGVGGAGALTNSGAAIGLGSAQTTNLALAADASIGGSGNWALLANGYGATSLNLAGFTLTKVGANAIYLVNSSVAAGSIRISSGSLQLSAGVGGSATGPTNASGVALSLDNASGAFLGLNNLALTLGSLAGGGALGGNVVLGSGDLTVGSATDTVYSGAISGTGRLIKQGAGVLSLDGSNTHSGGTTVNAGTLEFASGSLGTSGAVTLAGGALRWASGNAQDISSRLALTGSASLDTNGNDVSLASSLSGASSITLTKSGDGILTLGAASTGLASPWVVAAGTLRAGHAQAFGTGTIRVEGGVLDLNGLSVANVFTLAGGSVTGFTTLSASQLDLASTDTPKLSGTISGELNLAGKQVDATGGLAATGTLKGDGAVFSGGIVTLAPGATHAPGDSPGSQTFQSGLSYSSSSVLEWEFDLEPSSWTAGEPVRGVNFDAVNVTGGNLDIAAGAILQILLIDPLAVGFTDAFWDTSRTFSVIGFSSSGQITGLFTFDDSSANLAAAGEGVWGILHESGGVSLTWTPVPEPSTYGLALGGLCLAAAALRRRSRRA